MTQFDEVAYLKLQASSAAKSNNRINNQKPKPQQKSIGMLLRRLQYPPFQLRTLKIFCFKLANIGK